MAFFAFNGTVLGKEVGDASRGETFWKQVVQGNYGEEERGWSSCKVRRGYGVWVM